MASTTKDRKAVARKAVQNRRGEYAQEKRRANASADPHEIDHGHGDADHGAATAHDTPREEDMDWKRPSALEAPPARPGFVQRWIRTMIGSVNDPKNFNTRMREGWRPRPATTVPGGYNPPTLMHGQYGEVIGVEGMILCEMPVKMAQQRERFYKEQTRKQTAAVEMDVHKVERPNLPITASRKSRVEFRREARTPRTQDDIE